MNFLLSGGEEAEEEQPENSIEMLNDPAVESLKAMGFNEYEARNALAISGNDVDRACELLLSSENQEHAF